MDAISEHNKKYQFFADITSEAMKVHHKFHPGLLESAYEAALAYLLGLRGMKVERQVFLPIYWDDVQLDQTYRMDLVVNDDIIVELKAVSHTNEEHVYQLWNYMRLTHKPYGMLMNFGAKQFYSAWYQLYADGTIEKIKLY
jgi:GxxExxY protein